MYTYIGKLYITFRFTSWPIEIDVGTVSLLNIPYNAINEVTMPVEPLDISWLTACNTLHLIHLRSANPITT